MSGLRRMVGPVLVGGIVVATGVLGMETASPATLKFSQSSADAERIALGRALFMDTRLSKDSSISCASCHIPNFAFAEPRAVSHGLGRRARKRNTPTLLNVAGQASFDWDGRAKSLGEQLRGVFSVDGDMALDRPDAVSRLRADADYSRAFQRVFGRLPDVASLESAFTAFQESLMAANSPFDQFYLGGDTAAISPSARRGWELFRSDKSGCGGCHVPIPTNRGLGPISFTDGRFHNLGIGYRNGRMPDVGRYGVTGNPSDWGAFKTPSLRNVALTAPYMHDGSIATLEEVIAFYERGGNSNPNLDVVSVPRGFTEQNRADLAAFLRSLTTSWLTDSVAVRSRLLRFAGGEKFYNAHAARSGR